MPPSTLSNKGQWTALALQLPPGLFYMRLVGEASTYETTCDGSEPGKENQKTLGVRQGTYMNEAAWLWDNREWWGLGRIRKLHLKGATTTMLQLIVTT